MHLSFHLTAPLGSEIAQSAAIALRCRGKRFDWIEGDERETRLSIRALDGQEIQANMLSAMLNWLEDMCPHQPLYSADPHLRAQESDLVSRAEHLRELFRRVVFARNNRDLDLALYFLHDALRPVALHFQDVRGPLGNVDAAYAPVLWRAAELDRRYGSNILTAYPVLAKRLRILHMATPAGTILERKAGRALPEEDCPEAALSALLKGSARADWCNAFSVAQPASETRNAFM